MLSDKITAFERNRYFFGKLLTAGDFCCEQNYFNNKRRLINLLTFGTGVVCGMGVIKADDTSVAVESGFAFDSAGREIVLAQPVVKKLSALEGFNTLDKDGNQNIHSVYLCAEYSEEQTDAVHSVARNVLSDENEGSEYNKIRESCKFYITGSEPEAHPFDPYNASRLYMPLWNGDGVTVSLSAPKFVCANEDFFIETLIKKGSPEQQVSLNYKIELSFMTTEGRHTAEIGFCENTEGRQEEYIIRTPVRAASVNQATAVLTVKNINVSVNGFQRSLAEEKSGEFYTVKNKESAAAEFLRKRNLEESLQNRPGLYLARINLILTPDYFVIDKIENLPFNQAVLTPSQSESLRLSGGRPVPSEKADRGQENGKYYRQQKMNSGSLRIETGGKPVKGSTYFSKPVPHFLGVGNVMVTAALSKNGETFSGENIFDDSVAWSIKTDKVRGLFTIGVKLKKEQPPGGIDFDWFAFKIEERESACKKTLFLYPDVYYASPHETVAFEAKLSEGELNPGDLMWSVTAEEGGRINKNGIFTASACPGFYEIQAKSRDGKLCASAFVVI